MPVVKELMETQRLYRIVGRSRNVFLRSTCCECNNSAVNLLRWLQITRVQLESVSLISFSHDTFPATFLTCSGARRVAPSVPEFVVLLVCTSSGGFMTESLLVRFGPDLQDYRREQFNENMWTIPVVVRWDPIISDPVVRLTDCHFLLIYIPQQEIDISPGQWSDQCQSSHNDRLQDHLYHQAFVWTKSNGLLQSIFCHEARPGDGSSDLVRRSPGNETKSLALTARTPEPEERCSVGGGRRHRLDVQHQNVSDQILQSLQGPE